MSSDLDPDARELIQLAKLAEQRLPRNKRRIQRNVLLAVGAAVTTQAITSGVAQGAGVTLVSNAAQTAAANAGGAIVAGTGAKAAGSGIAWPFLLKALAVVSSVALVGVAAHEFAGDVKDQSEQRAAPKAARGVQTSTTPKQRIQETATAAVEPADNAPAQRPAESRAARSAASERGIPAREGQATRATTLAPAKPRVNGDAPQAIAQANERATADRDDLPASNHEATLDVASEQAVSPARSSSLSADLQVLRRAQQALNAGAPARAIAVLREIQGKELLAERTAIEVFAYCALGRRDVARGKAELFRKIATSSPLLPRVNASCAKP